MPVELNFNERRVLGTLVEKGFTTPEQYPLSLNSVVVGCNQKSCREPMSYLDEEKALDALESLQSKGFSTLVRMAGSRVDRWKHRFGEALTLDGKELSILAELFLRGAQTEGELRQRASRMRPIETLEELEQLLESLQSRPDALVVRLGPPGRARGVKYAHTFYPAGERPSADDTVEGEAQPSPQEVRPPPRPAVPFHPAGSSPGLEAATGAQGASAAPEELASLRREVELLKERVAELESTFVKFLR